MSSEKGTFSIYYGEENVIYGPNGVDLSEFNCAVRTITKLYFTRLISFV
jgi:hypothetical protein